jgi:hypothetical protein
MLLAISKLNDYFGTAVTIVWLHFLSCFFFNRLHQVIYKSVKHFKGSQQIDNATDQGKSYADWERNSASFFFYVISQMLDVSTFVNTADVYAIVHLVPHACQHITVDHICYYCLVATNQNNCVRGLFLKKTWRVSLSIGVRITMIRCVVYSLWVFKMFHGLTNIPVLSNILIHHNGTGSGMVMAAQNVRN